MAAHRERISASDSETFGKGGSFQLDKPVGSASISPCGRDIVLASRQGLDIIDLDSPFAPPRHLAHFTPWEVADVQWSPFAARDYWIVSTSNQKALVWNVGMVDTQSSVEHILHGHKRAITDINFSAHQPDILATCAVDSYVHCWDLRRPFKPAISFCDWFAGATQVKWNRQDSHVLASSHDKYLKIWDDRKGAHPLKTIAAHATKIYGVDWDRLDTKKVATCSLDKTIKLWNYDREDGLPEKVISTHFPVWRARHTPFGSGLIALPQRGNHDLHLYDQRRENIDEERGIDWSVHQFSGHRAQVKEFLWRPRGSVTDAVDDREFQLVSWGTDRLLRLHEVNNEVLSKVGYTQGMEVRRTLKFTRRGARYMSFRDEPVDFENDQNDYYPSSHPTAAASAAGISKGAMPLTSGYASGGFMGSVVNKINPSRKDVNPVSWMRGVKIGKRATSPMAVQDSAASLLSPPLRPASLWDTFDSLGEEITSSLDKFPNVKPNNIDVQRRHIAVSLSGPWAIDRTPIQLRCRLDFPVAYPTTAKPRISLEEGLQFDDQTREKILSEVKELAEGYLSHKRHSLEAVLRYLLGEQTLEESLQFLKRTGVGPDRTISLDDGLSSSSDEDEDDLGRYEPPDTNGLEPSDPMIAAANAQYNVPLPNTCGARWTGDGRLVRFSIRKPEKEVSLQNSSLGVNAGLQRDNKDLFESFGRLHKAHRSKEATSTLGTLTSAESENEFELSSSESSSSSNGPSLQSHHFLPAMSWNGLFAGLSNENALDISQNSVGDVGQPSTSAASNANMLISVLDLSGLLPVKKSLADRYVIQSGLEAARKNHSVAKDDGFEELVETWSLCELLLRKQMEKTQGPASGTDETSTSSRRGPSVSLDCESAIDLSLDDTTSVHELNLMVGAGSTNQSVNRNWLVQSLLHTFERLGDVQTLAMLVCTFARNPDSPHDKPIAQSPSSQITTRYEMGDNGTHDAERFSPEDVARRLAGFREARLLKQPDTSRTSPMTVSTRNSTPIVFPSLSSSATPPKHSSLAVDANAKAPHVAHAATSPEHQRTIPRTSSTLSALTASLPRPFQFNNLAAPSPPNSHPRKLPSPTGSYIGNTQPLPSLPSSKTSQIRDTLDDPQMATSPTTSEVDEQPPSGLPDTGPLTFLCKLKNKDQFYTDNSRKIFLLDPENEWKYSSWRQAYAQSLEVWDMPLEQAEILKYNSILPLSQTNGSLSTRVSATTMTPKQGETDELGISLHCPKCGSLVRILGSRECHHCHYILRPLLCAFCKKYINGLASPCLKCGHIMHWKCRKQYDDSGLFNDCITGCGCNCKSEEMLGLPLPDEKRWLGTAEASSLGEKSPAATIILDDLDSSSIVVNEQERAGWKDAVYASLSKTLSIEGRRSSGRGLRAKASQIWRSN